MSLEQTELKWIPPVIQTMFVDVEIAAAQPSFSEIFRSISEVKGTKS